MTIWINNLPTIHYLKTASFYDEIKWGCVRRAETWDRISGGGNVMIAVKRSPGDAFFKNNSNIAIYTLGGLWQFYKIT